MPFTIKFFQEKKSKSWLLTITYNYSFITKLSLWRVVVMVHISISQVNEIPRPTSIDVFRHLLSGCSSKNIDILCCWILPTTSSIHHVCCYFLFWLFFLQPDALSHFWRSCPKCVVVIRRKNQSERETG